MEAGVKGRKGMCFFGVVRWTALWVAWLGAVGVGYALAEESFLSDRRVKDIKISGQFPLFERHVVSAMSIRVGEIFIEEDLNAQAQRVENLYRREGFIAPKVRVEATEDRKDGHVVIDVGIEKGRHKKLRSLEISGNTAFTDAGLRMRMKTWWASHLPGSSGRFLEDALKSDVKGLIQLYIKKGYADVSMDYTMEEDAATGTTSVVVTVVEGPEYRVDFQGNEKFSDRILRKDLVFYNEGNRSDLGVKKSLKKIKARYHGAGYLEASVSVEEPETRETGIRLLRFVIKEGPRSTVDSVKIIGNSAFTDDNIRKQVRTRPRGWFEKGIYDPDVISEDLYTVKSLYATQGYLDAQVNEEVRWDDKKTKGAVTIRVIEGVQTKVSSVKFAGLTVIPERDAYGAIGLKEGAPFREYMLNNDENVLAALISEKGYPHVNVTGAASISEDKEQALIVYQVDEGPYVEMGQVYFKGNFRTKESALRRQVGLEPGSPFSLVQMLEAQRNVRNMGLFNSVKFNVIGFKEKKETVDMFVEVEEKKNYFAEIGGGYESQRGLFAHSRLGDHNLFGTNKDAWLGGEVSEIGYRAEGRVKEPRLFGSQTSADLGAFAERREEFNQDFGTQIYGASLGLTRPLFENVTTGLSFRFEEREQFTRDGTEEPGGEIGQEGSEFEPRRIFVAAPSAQYDTRDSFVHPRKGIFSSVSADISKGLTNSLDDFLKYRCDLHYYVSPLSRLTLACLGRFGYIDPYNATGRVPEDQLFFLGGTADVRGFKENLLRFDVNGDPVGGRSALAASAEARIDLGHDFEFTLFYDIGRVDDTFVPSQGEGLRASVGAGLRYVTAIGPIGFLYGINLDPEDGESGGRVHFAIGYTF